jgi:hypothetical protein
MIFSENPVSTPDRVEGKLFRIMLYAPLPFGIG